MQPIIRQTTKSALLSTIADLERRMADHAITGGDADRYAWLGLQFGAHLRSGVAAGYLSADEALAIRHRRCDDDQARSLCHYATTSCHQDGKAAAENVLDEIAAHGLASIPADRLPTIIAVARELVRANIGLAKPMVPK